MNDIVEFNSRKYKLMFDKYESDEYGHAKQYAIWAVLDLDENSDDFETKVQYAKEWGIYQYLFLVERELFGTSFVVSNPERPMPEYFEDPGHFVVEKDLVKLKQVLVRKVEAYEASQAKCNVSEKPKEVC